MAIQTSKVITEKMKTVNLLFYLVLVVYSIDYSFTSISHFRSIFQFKVQLEGVDAIF